MFVQDSMKHEYVGSLLLGATGNRDYESRSVFDTSRNLLEALKATSKPPPPYAMNKPAPR